MSKKDYEKVVAKLNKFEGQFAKALGSLADAAEKVANVYYDLSSYVDLLVEDAYDGNPTSEKEQQ